MANHFISNTFLLLLGYAKAYFLLHYRQTEGIAQGHTKGKVPDIPDYTTINRRINRLDIKIDDNKSKEFKDEYIVIAIDSTGIKVTDRGQWMQDKWNLRKNKKGYLKIHIAINVKTKKILAMQITDEHVHDSKPLPELVDGVIKLDSMTAAATIGKLFADGAYDNNNIFRYLGGKGILHCIKVRKMLSWMEKRNMLRNLSVLAQKNDLQGWKDSVIWTKMDCRNLIFLSKKNVWRICILG